MQAGVILTILDATTVALSSASIKFALSMMESTAWKAQPEGITISKSQAKQNFLEAK